MNIRKLIYKITRKKTKRFAARGFYASNSCAILYRCSNESYDKEDGFSTGYHDFEFSGLADGVYDIRSFAVWFDKTKKLWVLKNVRERTITPLKLTEIYNILKIHKKHCEKLCDIENHRFANLHRTRWCAISEND